MHGAHACVAEKGKGGQWGHRTRPFFLHQILPSLSGAETLPVQHMHGYPNKTKGLTDPVDCVVRC
jgi:hypothetical protein